MPRKKKANKTIQFKTVQEVLLGAQERIRELNLERKKARIWHEERVKADRQNGPARERKPRKVDQQRARRNKFIYEQCLKGKKHELILAEVRRRAKAGEWPTISSKQRVQQIGKEYSEQHELPTPPPRQNLKP